MAVLSTQTFGDPDGQPFLAVHGVTAHGARFRRTTDEGLPGWRAISVDLRGHGASLREPPWHREQHVADLLETMDAHGLDRVPVVGHSFGGMLALCLLGAAPERVDRIAMLDPAMALPPALARERAAGTLGDPGWATIDEARAARRAGRDADGWEDVDEDIERHLVQASDGRYRFDFERAAAVCAWSEMARELPAIPVRRPALLVAALQEIYVTPAVRDGLAALLGDQLSVLDLDCGHMVYWDCFDEVAGALRTFLGTP